MATLIREHCDHCGSDFNTGDCSHCRMSVCEDCFKKFDHEIDECIEDNNTLENVVRVK